MNDERSPACVRFDEWIRSTGQTPMQVATRIGCDSTHISKLRHGHREPGRDIALAIERESADWEAGPLRASEWERKAEAKSTGTAA